MMHTKYLVQQIIINRKDIRAIQRSRETNLAQMVSGKEIVILIIIIVVQP